MKYIQFNLIKKLGIIAFLGVFLILSSSWHFKNLFSNPNYQIGQPIDSLNSVIVYYNGPVSNVVERNVAPDGYNLGLKYQCVEFVKRYYYQHFKHKMPDSYGHAKDFFDPKVKDGELNKRRNLIQYTNSSKSKPKVGDLLVF
ncbi:MAG TPA: CHAP domain-containing protein, partial [Bacteroidia bacterium]